MSDKLTYTYKVSYVSNPSSPISVTPICYIYTGLQSAPTLLTSITANTITYVTNQADTLNFVLTSPINGLTTPLSIIWPSLDTVLPLNAKVILTFPP